jgi:hypothetical protein
MNEGDQGNSIGTALAMPSRSASAMEIVHELGGNATPQIAPSDHSYSTTSAGESLLEVDFSNSPLRHEIFSAYKLFLAFFHEAGARREDGDQRAQELRAQIARDWSCTEDGTGGD